MHPLHFSLGFVQFLANHRHPWLTGLFLGASFIGEAQFYVALIMLIYVAWDKHLAVRLSFVVLFAMSANDLLKNLIRNPRPFVRQGTYLDKWAVSRKTAANLVTEYSTPSGHAMGAAAFYSYMCVAAKNTWVRVASVLLILLIGFSRPYLGVHYGEDVVLGWTVGIVIGVAAAGYAEPMALRWRRLPYTVQIATALIAGFAASLACIALNRGHIDSQVNGTVAYGGFFFGVVVAAPLEQKRIRFDPRSGGPAAMILRFAITLACIVVALLAFKLLLDRYAASGTVMELVLEHLRYATAGFAGIFIAPWLFSRAHLVETAPA